MVDLNISHTVHRVNQDLIRKVLMEANLDVYYIPGTDPHQSEYFSPRWNFRKQFAGFTGSAGDVILGKEKGLVTTDSRYEIQIKNQVRDPYFETMVVQRGLIGLKQKIDWMKSHQKDKIRLGLDPRLISIQGSNQLREYAGEIIEIVYIKVEFLDMLWPNRPQDVLTEIVLREPNLDYLLAQDKIKTIQSRLAEMGLDAHIISDLESVARTLNLRGFDCLPNLLFISHLLVTTQKVILFIDTKKISRIVEDHLKTFLELVEYSQFAETLQTEVKRLKILVDPSELNMDTLNSLPQDCDVTYGRSLCLEIKKVKAPSEIEHIRKAHLRDGAALVSAFSWLQKELSVRAVSEYEMGKKLLEVRQQQAGFICHSFDPIVGYQSNGAIVHYRAEEGNCLNLKPEGVVLIDSGGHYFDGTTDVTRVMALGPVNNEMIQRYTDVLKGHIGINLLRFPKGIKPSQVDIIARQYLYQNGLDYGHGTGHGVGFGTAVHEASDVGLSLGHMAEFVSGAVLSNEPGYYQKNDFGIRIENLISVHENGGYLYFEQLTLVPYERDLIDVSRLTDMELKWLNLYHQKVVDEIGPLVNASVFEWLKVQCRPLFKNS